MKTRKLARTIVSVLFVGLLITTLIASRIGGFGTSNYSSIEQKETALKKFGFYLDPVNKAAGIGFKHTCPDIDPKLNHIKMQIASMGASVSVCDYDNDGWNDIYFTNSGTGSMNSLYHNLHNGKFEDVAPILGVADVNKKGTGASMGSVRGDFDNDGYKELLVFK
jgi:hypothetical protein